MKNGMKMLMVAVLLGSTQIVTAKSVMEMVNEEKIAKENKAKKRKIYIRNLGVTVLTNLNRDLKKLSYNELSQAYEYITHTNDLLGKLPSDSVNDTEREKLFKVMTMLSSVIKLIATETVTRLDTDTKAKQAIGRKDMDLSPQLIKDLGESAILYASALFKGCLTK